MPRCRRRWHATSRAGRPRRRRRRCRRLTGTTAAGSVRGRAPSTHLFPAMERCGAVIGCVPPRRASGPAHRDLQPGCPSPTRHRPDPARRPPASASAMSATCTTPSPYRGASTATTSIPASHISAAMLRWSSASLGPSSAMTPSTARRRWAGTASNAVIAARIDVGLAL